jgi:hypothetical protein
MNKWLFVLIAFCVGETFTAVFLMPVLNEIYEPNMHLPIPLSVFVWIILYLIIPTIIGGAIEGPCLVFFHKHIE